MHGMLDLAGRLPPGLDPRVASLLRGCLAEEPAARPDMREVLARLADVRELPQPAPAPGPDAPQTQ